MPNFDSSLRECFGFSQMIISELVRVFVARELISLRLPIGVETIYKPVFITILLFLFISLASCTPVNNKVIKNTNEAEKSQNIPVKTSQNLPNETADLDELKIQKKIMPLYLNNNIQNNVTIILSEKDNKKIVSQFINTVELAVYQKKINDITFSIKLYKDMNELEEYLSKINLSGKIFIGPLNSQDSKLLQKYCSEGAIFFSFSSNTMLAKDCVFLVNFFPENELKTLFDYFPDNSRVALLYPENEYGFGINKVIDKVADQSNSIIVNRASYKEDLSNASVSIKELGKYELRKYELNRQKKILATKKDEKSKKRLIRLEKFQTTKDFDFSHIIIADYGLRLLKVAPLLPYYDIDPNIVKFVGTGAWDDRVFYDEPSLDGSIYPGIEYKKRQKLMEDYKYVYEESLLRTSTLPYDLVGLLDYFINNKFTIKSFYETIGESNLKFAGVDGNFYFQNNKIERDLQILQITNGDVGAILKQK